MSVVGPSGVPYSHQAMPEFLLCEETGALAVDGRCPLHGGDACLHRYFRAYRTMSGKLLTEADLEALADEAERGYDVSQLKPRRTQ